MRSILTVNLIRPCNAYSQSSCFSFVLVYSCFHKLLFRESLIISHSQNKTNTHQLLVRTLLVGFKININHLSREDRNTQYFHFISQNSFLCHGPVPVCNSSCIRLKRGRWGRKLCGRRRYCVFYIDRFSCIWRGEKVHHVKHWPWWWWIVVSGKMVIGRRKMGS